MPTRHHIMDVLEISYFCTQVFCFPHPVILRNGHLKNINFSIYFSSAILAKCMQNILIRKKLKWEL